MRRPSTIRAVIITAVIVIAISVAIASAFFARTSGHNTAYDDIHQTQQSSSEENDGSGYDELPTVSFSETVSESVPDGFDNDADIEDLSEEPIADDIDDPASDDLEGALAYFADRTGDIEQNDFDKELSERASRIIRTMRTFDGESFDRDSYRAELRDACVNIGFIEDTYGRDDLLTQHLSPLFSDGVEEYGYKNVVVGVEASSVSYSKLGGVDCRLVEVESIESPSGDMANATLSRYLVFFSPDDAVVSVFHN